MFLEVDGRRIAYEATGDGPLIVLTHGMGDLRSTYRFLAPRLVAAGYRVVATDMRGCGESDAGWPTYDQPAIACPVEVVMGAQDADFPDPAAEAHTMAGMVPDAHVTMVEGAGHYVMQVRPAETEAAVLDLL